MDQPPVEKRGPAELPFATDPMTLDMRQRRWLDGDMQQRLEWLESRVNAIESSPPVARMPLPTIFVGSPTQGSFQEMCVGMGSDNTFSAGVRVCNSTANAATLITLGANEIPILEVQTPGEFKYVVLSCTSFAKITGHTGAGPLSWNPYNLLFPDGSTSLGYNALEPITGTQNPTGLDFATTGTLTGTSCVGLPVGTTVNYIPVSRLTTAAVDEWIFAIPNSAG